jgi:polyhydroxyalkanoate synthesis repressor PhaR
MARLIKRYENRKLYDTEASAYVSLSDIADLVRQGETVQVIDNVTGDDLTAQTLTQIILEEGKQGKHVLPTDLLHDLLRRGGEVVDTGLDRLRHGMDDLVQSSVGRLNQLVPDSQRRSEIRDLRDQVNHLEGVLNDLLEDLEQKKTKKAGTTNNARR